MVLRYSKHTGKRVLSFFSSLSIFLGYAILFLSLNFRHSLLQTVTLCILGRANLNTNQDAQLHHFGSVAQDDMLSIYHSLAPVFPIL